MKLFPAVNHWTLQDSIPYESPSRHRHLPSDSPNMKASLQKHTPPFKNDKNKVYTYLKWLSSCHSLLKV